MKTPREKYMNDPEYHSLVNMLEQVIEQARFTPSELREACILASINYEMRHVRDTSTASYREAEDALRILECFANRRRQRQEVSR